MIAPEGEIVGSFSSLFDAFPMLTHRLLGWVAVVAVGKLTPDQSKKVAAAPTGQIPGQQPMKLEAEAEGSAASASASDDFQELVSSGMPSSVLS